MKTDASDAGPPLLPAETGRAEPVVTTGSGLAALAWRGSLLTIATLGLYRFWYKTDLRRWYWRHTLAGGSALEYRGTAKELLIGFLFAIAVLAPLYAIVALIGLFASAAAGAASNAAFALIFLLLVQYGAYRSRRYRLTRTVWRGLRFDQTGSAWAYAAKSLGWMLLSVLSIGLAVPLMRRALEAHKIRRTRFGSAEGRFDAAAGALMATWLIVVGPLLLGLAFGAAAGLSALVHPGDAPPLGLLIGAGVTAACGAVWAVLLWPLYRIREFRIFADATAIGPVRFRSAAPAKAAYAIYARFLLVGSVATSAIGVVAAAAIAAGGGPVEAFAGARSAAVAAALALLYLGGFLALGVLKEVMLNQPFWRLMAGTLMVEGLDRLDDVLNLAFVEEAATGEGLADALDFGGV